MTVFYDLLLLFFDQEATTMYRSVNGYHIVLIVRTVQQEISAIEMRCHNATERIKIGQLMSQKENKNLAIEGSNFH